jgi:diphosphomevalonate decarboxylase
MSVTKFSVPSNIAFVKYWGKKGRQLPLNPSISMTLAHCYTEMSVSYIIDEDKPGVDEFIFEDEGQEAFKVKIEKYLLDISDIYPIGQKLRLKINSKNTFPHSAGIASSASAMGALACCLAEIESEIEGTASFLDHPELFRKRATFLARLASGSAARSIFPGFVSWGKSGVLENSSDEYAMVVSDIHPSFTRLCDSVLIVSQDPKSVSSSEGHRLMNAHLYKNSRIEQANENYRVLLNYLKNGEWDCFGEVLENEALTLHGLMMSSNPSYVLLLPESLVLIEKIRRYRKQFGLQMYFTIDAGPNIHLIYPEKDKAQVIQFMEKYLAKDCKVIIHDQIGEGPKKL